MRFLRLLLIIGIVAVFALVALRLSHPLPDLPRGEASAAIPARLARA